VLLNDSLVRWEFADPLPDDDKVRASFANSVAMNVGSGDPRGMSWKEHRLQVGDLSRALLEGRRPMIPGAEARRAVQLVMAVYESARTRKPVRL
jgi:predicted dehydrogenase